MFAYLEGGLISHYQFSLSSLATISSGLLKLTALGYQGVSVFVVMAGFLALWTTRNMKFEVYRYYGRRFCRLYPLYWIALSLVIMFRILEFRMNPFAYEEGEIVMRGGMRILGMYIGFYPMDTYSWILNPSLWFMTMIIQLFMFFPLLRGLLLRVKDVKFLILMGIFSFVFLYIFRFTSPLAGQFAGCWLFEFSFGMVMANNLSGFDKMLSGIKIMPLLFLAYLLGFFLGSYSDTWPIGRPLYGIALAMLLWSIYNNAEKVRIFKALSRVFVLIGVNSYALYLINQPLVHTYFDLVSSHAVSFTHPIFGSEYNLTVLPIERYLLIMLSFLILVVFLSYVLTRVDNCLQKKLHLRNEVPGKLLNDSITLK